MIQDVAKEYLTNPYYIFCNNDTGLKFGCLHLILNFDYCDNIKNVPKYEAQKARFSWQQHILHCCDLQNSNDDIATNQFLYHLPDDTSHKTV